MPGDSDFPSFELQFMFKEDENEENQIFLDILSNPDNEFEEFGEVEVLQIASTSNR